MPETVAAPGAFCHLVRPAWQNGSERKGALLKDLGGCHSILPPATNMHVPFVKSGTIALSGLLLPWACPRGPGENNLTPPWLPA
jgi:hypothetical protein